MARSSPIGIGAKSVVVPGNCSKTLRSLRMHQFEGVGRLVGRAVTHPNLSIRDQNGELIKFDTLLEDAAKLMAGTRSEQEKMKIAEMLGLSREWVRVLRDGPEAFRAASAEAHNAGAVIDKETVQRAKDFDRAWTAAIVKFKAGMVDGLAELSRAFGEIGQAMAVAAQRAHDSHTKLLQFAVEGRDFVKQFDQTAISAFGSFENEFSGFILGTKTAKEAFSDMAQSILSDLTKMILRMAITAPIAQAIAGAFGVPAAPIPYQGRLPRGASRGGAASINRPALCMRASSSCERSWSIALVCRH